MEVSSLVGRELSKVAQEIEFFVNSAVANQKKLQYAVSQLRLFARAFNLRFPRLSPLTQKQIQAADGIVKNASKLKSIISQNMSNCWANSVISNSSSAVAAEVCEIIRRLNAEASILDPEDSHFFDPADPKWLQLHLFDLHSIHTSFKSFLEGENNSISSNIQTIIKSRLQSIDNFIKEYERESIVPPNIVFTPIPIHYKTWTLDVNDIIEEKQIGSGVSSNVFYGTLKSTKEKVAIKKFKYKLTGSRFRSFQREVTTLATTIHDTLLRFIGVTETPPYCIVTEWMPGGNLYNELHKRKKLTPTQLTIVAYDIARGMNFLHKHQIIHRDLKSLNVLLDDKGRAKICDFGSSKKFGKTEIMTVNVGTPYWMAPELLSGHQNYDTKVDVYSYGIVLWEILFHKTPYNGCDHLEVIHSVLDNDARPSFPGIWFPEELEDLINSCWERDPRNRPTFSTILKLFQTGKIYFPGTDISLFLQHVQETQSTDDKDSLQIQELLQRSDVTLEDFSYTINNSSIPNDYLEETWNKLETFQASPNLPLLSLCYSKFLTTGKAFQASERLRSFPRGQISKEIIVKFLSNVPTGNEELDENLLIISCKNNMTEEALIHSLSIRHTILCLETLTRGSIKSEYKSSIIARCILSLSNDENDNLKISSLRCLISMKETKNISLKLITNMLIQTKNVLLKNVIYLVIYQMINENVKFNIDFIDWLISFDDNSKLAIKIIAKMCKIEEIAKVMLKRFQSGFYEMTYEVVIEIFKVIAVENKMLKNELKVVLEKFRKIALDDYLEEVEKIEIYLEGE